MPATNHDLSPSRLPRTLGRYTLVRKLGTGGMADRFLAIQRGEGFFEKLAVVERLLPPRAGDPAFLERLLHRARLAAPLSHPNVVQILDAGTVDGTYFIATEHVLGVDLRAIMRRTRTGDSIGLPMEHALSLVIGVCAGLAYAHDERDLDGAPLHIVHGCISPQNVLVNFSGDIKINDFGIAQSGANSAHDEGSDRLDGMIAYMSPEQARGERIDWRSDIFSVGVILFELTTGHRLFEAANIYETRKRIGEGEYPRPSRVRRGFPPALEAIVMRALARDPRERWQSAREMQGALEEFIRQERIGASRTRLAAFMASLFEDRLTAQRKALLRDREVADSVALAGGAVVSIEEAGVDRGVESRHPSSLAPTTLIAGTDVPAPQQGRAAIVLGALALLAVVAMASGAARSWNHRASAVGANSSATDALVAPTDDHGSIAVASSPPGAAIFVNGARTSRTTPAMLTNVAFGVPIVVGLAADGFELTSRSVTLTDANPVGGVRVVLQPDVRR
jgi:eukaryotic-like serine/threonine-protein kinase